MKFKNRKNYLILLIIAICWIIPSVITAGDVQSITAENLASGTWGPENRLGMKIKFTREGRFEFVLDYGQSYSDAAGSYTIKNGKLNLAVESSNTDKSSAGMNIKNGILSTDASSPKYRRYILFKAEDLKDLYIHEDLKIWDYNSVVKEGESLSIKGIDASGMGVKEAATTAVVKVRESPGVNAKEIHYSYEDADGTTVNVKALPKDTTVIVLARTKEKDKVGKWTNYWYYVEFEKYFDYGKGWVYGEFVQIK